MCWGRTSSIIVIIPVGFYSAGQTPFWKAGDMLLRSRNVQRALLLLSVTYAGALLLPSADAASCKTGSQMTPAQRDALSNAARTMAAGVQSGDVQTLQANTIPEVAANFAGIAASVTTLKPLVQRATITVDAIYELDASTEPAGAARTDFYCGTPLVVLNFNGLPPGTYALAIVHATGVPQPQQISLILAQTAANRWMLAGFFSKPMIEAGHDGLWYWDSARKYAQRNMNWDAWFYYRMAADLLDPVEFLSSPNLDKLRHETDSTRPSSFPGAQPMPLTAQGAVYNITAIDTTVALGPLDLEVHYTPDAAQAARLRDPSTARKQVIDVMTALLVQHPELQAAFHGVWIHADQGNASVFALELPMEQIATGTQPSTPTVNPVPR